jgi:hypothetical protein
LPINQSDLINKSFKFQPFAHESLQKSFSLKQNKSVFLCHSHKDETIVKGLLVLFEEAGVDLYIDWKDHTMPDVPNVETARKIQDKIKGCDQFIFLASANSKASRWCPWEIGYADSSKRSIFIIPTYDYRDTYGNEYLDLYPRIDVGSLGTLTTLAVFEPGKSTGRIFRS